MMKWSMGDGSIDEEEIYSRVFKTMNVTPKKLEWETKNQKFYNMTIDNDYVLSNITIGKGYN